MDDDDREPFARMEHCPGASFNLGGLRRCDCCGRYYAPEDIQDFGARPPNRWGVADATASRGGSYPPICIRCVAERSQRKL